MMTVDSLQQQYQTQWPTLSERQQAAFRGNVTWLPGRTTNPDDHASLLDLQQRILGERPIRSLCTSEVPARRFHLNATRLELRRTRLTLAETPATPGA